MEIDMLTLDEVRTKLKDNASLFDHVVSIILTEEFSADYHFHFGMICNCLQFYEEADKALEKALEMDPNHSETLFEEAYMDEEPMEAITKYKRIIDHDSDNASRAYAKIGYLYKDHLQDPVKAIEAFNKAIELYDPNNHIKREDLMRLHRDLGLLYLKIGDSASAQEQREYLRSERSEYAEDKHWNIDTSLAKGENDI